MACFFEIRLLRILDITKAKIEAVITIYGVRRYMYPENIIGFLAPCLRGYTCCVAVCSNVLDFVFEGIA